MKAKLFLGLAFVLLPIAPATANDQGAWVKVDASGNAISGPIVCTSDVCGNPNSLYNQMTLGAGERYVLQFAADPVTGGVAGIGNNNPGLDVKVDLETNQWTTTRINTEQKVTETWISGAQTSERAVQVERITPEPKKQSFNGGIDWELLLSLGFEDLIRWLMKYFDGIVIP